MGRVTGLEPATLWTTTRCSNQLSYTRHNKDLAESAVRQCATFESRLVTAFAGTRQAKATDYFAHELNNLTRSWAFNRNMLRGPCRKAPYTSIPGHTAPRQSWHGF